MRKQMLQRIKHELNSENSEDVNPLKLISSSLISHPLPLTGELIRLAIVGDGQTVGIPSADHVTCFDFNEPINSDN